MKPAERQHKLSRLCLANAESMLLALQYCADSDIGCFRIGSSILPVKTHPQVGYSVDDLPESDMIVGAFRRCGAFAGKHGIRTVFHPDQFVVLNSPREDVVEKSIDELEYQAEVAEWVGADVINIHGGGAYGDKTEVLARFARNLESIVQRGSVASQPSKTTTRSTRRKTCCRYAELPACHWCTTSIIIAVCRMA